MEIRTRRCLLYTTAVICVGEGNTKRRITLHWKNWGTLWTKAIIFSVRLLITCILCQTPLCVSECLKSLTPGDQNKRHWKGNLLTVISYFLCCWLDLCLNKNIYFCGGTGAPWFCSEGSVLCLILASCHDNNYDVMNSVQWLHCSVFYIYSQFFSHLASKPRIICMWYCDLFLLCDNDDW